MAGSLDPSDSRGKCEIKGKTGAGGLDSVSTRGEVSLCGVVGDNRGFGAKGKAGGLPRETDGRFGIGGGVSPPDSAGELAGEDLAGKSSRLGFSGVSIFGISTFWGDFSTSPCFSFRFLQHLQHKMR